MSKKTMKVETPGTGKTQTTQQKCRGVFTPQGRMMRPQEGALENPQQPSVLGALCSWTVVPPAQGPGLMGPGPLHSCAQHRA